MPIWSPPPLPSIIEQGSRGGQGAVSSGSVDTKGGWSVLITASALEAYGFWLMVYGQNVGAAVHSSLIDIGVGPSDPPAIVVPDYLSGGAQTLAANGVASGRMQFFPIHIEAGSKMWARHAANTATKTITLKIALDEHPPYGDPWSSLENVTVYGATVSGSKGINCTSGTDAYGTQVQITASTTKDHKAWIMGMGMAGDTTINANSGIFAQLLIGSGTTGPIGVWDWMSQSSENVAGPFPPIPIYQPVPSGTRIDARIHTGGTGDVFDICAYGLD